MERTRIKICGLVTPQDARSAAEAGADALGVILHADSPRCVSLFEAAELFSVVPPFVARVGVFVDAPESVVKTAVKKLDLHYVQFHGNEEPAICAWAPVPAIKAFRVGDDFEESTVMPYMGLVAAALVDSFDPVRQGGTGVPFAWDLIEGLSKRIPLILAGGLNSENVAEAIERVRPFAVDVASGVERHPRAKDPVAMRDFCAAVLRANVERSLR